MSERHDELREQVAASNKELAAADLVIHAFGNVSQVDRGAGVFAIKPSGIPCHQVTARDIVVVSLEDGSVVAGDLKPSSDTPTHRILYQKLMDIGGVAHTHSRYATAWAQARLPIPCLGTTHADHFRGPVPVTRPLDEDEIRGDYEANTGHVIAELYGPEALDPQEAPGALVASHGPFVWADSGSGAVGIAGAVEYMAWLAAHTIAIQPNRPAIEPALVERHFGRKHGPLAYYGQR